MAGGIDETTRKPRRLHGTPALKFGNRLAFAVLGVSSLIGIGLFYQFSLPDIILEKLNIDILHVSEDEREKRALVRNSFVPAKRADQILQILKEKEGLEKDQ